MKKTVICVLMMLAFVFSVNQIAGATTITLKDENSEVHIDPTAQSGMYDWLVDGSDILYQQWFWYRVGATAEASIDAMTFVSGNATDSDANGLNDNYNAKYRSDTTFEITTNFKLTGGSDGSKISDIAETIKIKNISGQNLDFHFFQYTDFDLPATLNTANHKNLNAVFQSGTMFFNETVVTPSPEHWQVAYYHDILDTLNDLAPTTLMDGVNGLPAGDLTFAFQWDRVIAPGGTLLISKDKLVGPVPEPATMLLLGSMATGLFGFAGLKKRFTK